MFSNFRITSDGESPISEQRKRNLSISPVVNRVLILQFLVLSLFGLPLVFIQISSINRKRNCFAYWCYISAAALGQRMYAAEKCRTHMTNLRICVPLAALCGYYSTGISRIKGPKLTWKWKILTCVNEK